ncbi:N-acetylglucosamine-6-phosphate deacetylase [Nocardia uniformis]|uniref:N-acetylglucosamine-6-phosphate deacetylase n=1 Tax=Nocardia uniformis TaxID=53432 RepID=A0A849CE29_9NOCA|nr:N-acetylglucosamine-6-phosphate deacetylase [Nocardia uniformis]NNH74820.1 N-acetylglucosamine-6-phosphate deacetylase [Nocardia uniformis]
MSPELHIRGRIVSPAHSFDDGVVSVGGERIIAVRGFAQWRSAHPDAPTPLSGGTVLPGLVDIHNHGGAGFRCDTTEAADTVAAVEYHRSRGSTTVLASIVTAAPETMVAQVGALRELAETGVIGGIHIEGPFLSGVRCGAQDPRYLLHPDPELTRRFIDTAGGQLRIMTLAPELPGFDKVARLLTEHGVTVSLGHSDADYPTFLDALRPKGFATSVTHLANGMPPLHHRDPGPVGAALTAAARGQVTVELIGDGIHVDPGFGALVFAIAAERVALITDAMQAAGMPDGVYRLGPQEVLVSAGVARVASGSIAGGTSHLLQCVAWAVRECGVRLEDAVRAATLTPARTAGLEEIGDLAVGCYADLIVVDDDLRLRRVLRRGGWLA